ncbi:hypothetical protein IGI04_003475 [Brassica rapa subsp. trilocularis]|uniref:Secreted protein n=1 Tax=Brassica rapa subsp. trilocularis TaxID=1813537 RepID=A0ABQ7NYH8_BRACM|nr:hypothetical protein IGI04_003475 [Brassica rapa subsp. trilocularis]
MSLSVFQICSAYFLVYLLGLSLPEPKCHNRVSKPKYNSFAEAEDNLKKRKKTEKKKASQSVTLDTFFLYKVET